MGHNHTPQGDVGANFMIDDPPHIIFTNHTPQGDVGNHFSVKIFC